MAIGTPANGRGSSALMASAAAMAPSASMWVKALIVGWSASIRSSAAVTSSDELI